MTAPHPTSGTLVLITVGTDHHPFSRLIDWVEQCRAEPFARSVEFVCQHGTAPRPAGSAHSAFFPHDEFHSLMARSDAIVTHGGPGTVLEVLRGGRRPIVVPRRQEHGEAVDNHQVEFARFMVARGLVSVADSAQDLSEALAEALGAAADGERWRSVDAGLLPSLAESVAAFTAVARELEPVRRAQLMRGRPGRAVTTGAPSAPKG